MYRCYTSKLTTQMIHHGTRQGRGIGYEKHLKKNNRMFTHRPSPKIKSSQALSADEYITESRIVAEPQR